MIIEWICCKCKKVFSYNRKTLKGVFPACSDAFSNSFDRCEECFKKEKEGFAERLLKELKQ